MTVELFSNITQTIVSIIATFFLIGYTYKTKKIECALFAGFLSGFALGILYWVTYQFLNAETPQIFYVADLAWLASNLFLVCLQIHITKEEAWGYRHFTMYIAALIGIILIIYFCQWGDILANILSVGTLTICSYYALRNLMYNKKHKIISKYKAIHIFCIVYVITEYSLWISSCFWISDTMTNPYFWFDFLLTLLVGASVPIIRKVAYV